jgi:hypothetical protein
MHFKEELTIEHVIPLSKGGNDLDANKRDCCVRCNVHRQNKPLDHWLGELRARYDGLPEGHPERERCQVMMVNIEGLLAFIGTNGRALYKTIKYK